MTCSSFYVVMTVYKIAFLKVRNFYFSFLDFSSLCYSFKALCREGRYGGVEQYHTEKALGNCLHTLMFLETLVL